MNPAPRRCLLLRSPGFILTGTHEVYGDEKEGLIHVYPPIGN